MRTNKQFILLAGLMAGLVLSAVGQAPDAPEKKEPASAPEQKPPAAPAPAAVAAPGAAPVPPAAVETPAAPAAPVRPVTTETEKGLRFNFRGVPLDMVLNYMSDAAGFIIVMETEPKGKVDVWSNQPLTKEEAVDLLNTILNKNGYAAIRNGRTLKIISRDEAKTRDIPVRSGADPDAIPKNEEMITQVIPVRHANATQLTRDLQPLLPAYATLTANESGNALVLTDTQSSIRRMVEIVQALDTTISSVSSIRVFPLKFADSKEMATAIKELFQSPSQQTGGGGRAQQFFNRFGGGGFGGPGGFGGGTDAGGGGGRGGGGGGNNGGGGGANTKVVAIADERANALVVSAPEDVMPSIVNLVKEMDVSVADVTELRVFRLMNADPQEMADLLSELFPDDTKTGNNSSQGGLRFNQGGGRGGGPGGFGAFGGLFGGGNRNNTQSASSERAKKMGRVAAVPDLRTSSLIVSAASELMPQIAAMIEQLDASKARKQKVFVYSLENADVQQVEQIVRDMFERSNTGNRNNANQNSPLLNRSQQNQQTTPGGTGFGNNGGFGGNGGGGFGGGGGQFGR